MAQQKTSHVHDCITMCRPDSTISPNTWDRVPTRIKRALLRAGVLRPEDLRFWTLPEVIGINGLGTRGRTIVQDHLAGKGITVSNWAQ